ncbi:hypothetical protein [Desulfothermobacter acidiphilus]|uniref:hypothetical protein n=1 Tax=Desulfothermobacter acidiphilus TaxID=1938353 RepID=UPI003F8A134D
MREATEAIRELADRLLRQGEVELFLGYSVGTLPLVMRPSFITQPEQVSELVYNPLCLTNLVKYLLRCQGKRVALLVRRCELLSWQQLLADRDLDRDAIKLVEVPCGGLLDPCKLRKDLKVDRLEFLADRGQEYVVRVGDEDRVIPKQPYLCSRCLNCPGAAETEAVDFRLDFSATYPRLESDPYAGVIYLEQRSDSERREFWDRQLRRCLRCYACREVCPACSCHQCCFDPPLPGWQRTVDWVSKAHLLAEIYQYHLTRLLHVAGRCSGCGECERVCPVKIPLMLMVRKLDREVATLAEVSPGVLASYAPDDPEIS